MAIVVENTYTGSGTNTSFNITSVVVPSADDLLLLVAVCNGGPATPVVKYDGVDLTPLVAASSGAVIAGREASLWYMKDPPVGSATVAVTNSGSAAGAAAFVYVLSGVDQAGTFRTPATDQASTGTSNTLNVESAVDDLVIDAMSVRSAAPLTEGPNQDETYETLVGTNLLFGTSTALGAATSVDMEWAWTASDHNAQVAVAIVPAGGPSPLWTKVSGAFENFAGWFKQAGTWVPWTLGSRHPAFDLVGLKAALISPDTTVWMRRVSSSEYWMIWRTNNDRYIYCKYLQAVVFTDPYIGPASTPFKIGASSAILPYNSVDQSSGEVVESGSGWSTVSDASYFGASVRRTDTSGDSVTWTTTASATRLALLTARTTAGGYGLVTIDGSATAANELLTAQDYVTAGRLASTALVANGGTLNPTDRLFDFYSNPLTTWDVYPIAKGLADSTHVVVVTNTGYADISSSGIRVLSDGYATLGDPNSSASYKELARLKFGATEYELAFRTYPTGGDASWSGGGHGYDEPLSVAFTADGSPLSMVDGEVVAAEEFVITQTSELTHPDVDAAGTAIAEVDLTHQFTAEGVTYRHVTTWMAAINVDTAYMAMMTMDQNTGAEFTRASGSAIFIDVDISVDGEAFTYMNRSDAIWMWTPSSSYVAITYVDDVSTALNGWVSSGLGAFVWDRPNNKAYWPRVATDAADTVTAVSEVWDSTPVTFRVASVTDPDAICSREP